MKLLLLCILCTAVVAVCVGQKIPQSAAASAISRLRSTNAQAESNSRLNENQENAEKESIRKIIKSGILNLTLQFEHVLSRTTSYDENILFAPVNIVGVLATLLLGAESTSKTEILKVLALDSYSNKDKIHSTLGELLTEFLSEHKSNSAVLIEFAKAIFIQDGLHVQNEFKQLAKKYYENEIISVDYLASNNKAVNLINNWVKTHTKGRITEIINPPLSSNTKLVLANILFFNGEWAYPFYANSTWVQFFGENGIVKVKMMLNRSPAYTYDNLSRKFSVLGLPYKGGNLIMYLVLPDKGKQLNSLLSELTAKDLSEIAANATLVNEVTYMVPSMTLNGEVDLKRVLQRVGVRSIFDEAAAKLSKIADDVFVSDAIHKVNLDITEAGSTGAAATALTIETRFPDHQMYLFNRGFAFYIYHRPTGMVTFWGTINLPTPYQKL